MPPAARVLDTLSCSMHVVPPSPVTGVVSPRVDKPTVNIGFLPAAREGDKVKCAAGPEGNILLGDPTVFIEGRPAARMGDPIGHVEDPVTHKGVPSGVIGMGCVTVNIGILPQVTALKAASQQGSPFCEECAAAKNAQTKKAGP